MAHQINISDVERYRQANSLRGRFTQAEVTRWQRSRESCKQFVHRAGLNFIDNLAGILDKCFVVIACAAFFAVILIFASIVFSITSGRVHQILENPARVLEHPNQ